LTEAQSKAISDLKLKDLKAKNFFFQAIERVVLETILKKDTAKDIWDSLKKNINAQVESNVLNYRLFVKSLKFFI